MLFSKDIQLRSYPTKCWGTERHHRKCVTRHSATRRTHAWKYKNKFLEYIDERLSTDCGTLMGNDRINQLMSDEMHCDKHGALAWRQTGRRRVSTRPQTVLLCVFSRFSLLWKLGQPSNCKGSKIVQVDSCLAGSFVPWANRSALAFSSVSLLKLSGALYWHRIKCALKLALGWLRCLISIFLFQVSDGFFSLSRWT